MSELSPVCNEYSLCKCLRSNTSQHLMIFKYTLCVHVQLGYPQNPSAPHLVPVLPRSVAKE